VAAKETYNFSTFTALVVDDNRFIRTIVSDLCRSFKFGTVVDVADAASAFEFLKQSPVDVVICDWEMQPLDGYDFVRLVRTAKDSPNRFLPIIMLTGHTEHSRIVRARDAGATEFLAKPISATTLLRRICAVVDQPRPYIDCAGFFGPDRRRKAKADYKGAERRIHAGSVSTPSGADSPASGPDLEDPAAWGLPADADVDA